MKIREPKDDDRAYYRSRETGHRGYLVWDEDSDTQHIRVFRGGGGGHTFVKKFDAKEWGAETDFAPLSGFDVAHIRQAADCALAETQREYKRSRQAWMTLSPKARRAWMDAHPQDDLRKALSEGIAKALERFMRRDD